MPTLSVKIPATSTKAQGKKKKNKKQKKIIPPPKDPLKREEVNDDPPVKGMPRGLFHLS